MGLSPVADFYSHAFPGNRAGHCVSVGARIVLRSGDQCRLLFCNGGLSAHRPVAARVKPRRILALYKLRWNIETYLRSLKRTVGLHQLTSKTRPMVEKEVLMAVSAYNLVRTVIYLAARRAGVAPRQLSFSTAQDAVMAAWPHLQRARTQAQYHRELERLLQIVAQSKLPQRSGRRSYPREIWGRGGHFPFRKSSPAEEASR